MFVQPPLGVIPTVFLGGPLALLSLLFPGVFGGVAVFGRRWFGVCLVLSVNSSLYWLHAVYAPAFWRNWPASTYAIWLVMGLIGLAGAWWTCRRPVARLEPGRGDWTLLLVMGLAFLGVLSYGLWWHLSLLAPQQRWVLIGCVSAWAGLGQATLLRWRMTWVPPMLRLAPQGIMLGALGVGCLVPGIAILLSRAGAEGPVSVAWTFRPEDKGAFFASPLVANGRVYTAGAHESASSRYGRVYCLDSNDGRLLWQFDDNGAMKQGYSSPCLWHGRLYIGEGLHVDMMCKLYCLDAASGKKLWDFQTQGHTESSPCVAAGRVYVGAGDDGMYCLNAVNGAKIWHFAGPHVDGRPVVFGDRVFAGSGYGTLEVFCLDAGTGKPIWREPVDLSAFASPSVDGEQVFFGLGNGNMRFSANDPAGALLALDLRTGKRNWCVSFPDGLHAQPIVGVGRVYVTSRDHFFYALDSHSGALIWRRDLGSPIVTAPVLRPDGGQGTQATLTIATSSGIVWCLDAASGAPEWSWEMSERSYAQVEVLSTPALEYEPTRPWEGVRIYVSRGPEPFTMKPALYCLEVAWTEVHATSFW